MRQVVVVVARYRKHLAVAVGLLAAVALGAAALALALTNNHPAQTYVTQKSVTSPWFPANNHPDTLPVADRNQTWVRIDTPAGYPLILRACMGAKGHEDGVYADQDGAMYVVPNDPECNTVDPPSGK